MEQNKYDIEDRLVNYTCRMIDVVESLPGTRAGNYIAGQLIKSCHSPTFNYGEAQAAESRDDFIHKLAVVLKELKECRTALKIKRLPIKQYILIIPFTGRNTRLTQNFRKQAFRYISFMWIRNS